MNLPFNIFNQPEAYEVYLANTNRAIMGNITDGIDRPTGSLTMTAKDSWKLSFDYYRYINDTQTDYYEQLGQWMRLYIPNIGWFVMSEPTIINDGINEKKRIVANSLDFTFIQRDLKGWKINCGTTDSREMLVEGNVDNVDGVEFAKEQIKFYNPDKPDLSLLDILLEDNPEWSIKYVDPKPKEYKTIIDDKEVIQYKKLKDEIGKFDVSNQSKFAFMTQDLPKYFECILVFDISDLTISAYRVENLGKDTNIILNFRNYQNSHEISVSEENNIFTRYYVSGGEGLNNVYFANFGINMIDNLSFFLRTDLMPEDLILKYKAWEKTVEKLRPEYIKLSKLYNNQLNKIAEIENRVPLDGCNQDWATMKPEELANAKATYQAQLKGYESFYVDAEGKFDEEALKKSDDANDYYQIKDVIIPNIDIALKNQALPDSTNLEEYIDSYKTDWKLYGTKELEVNLQLYKEKKKILEENHYDLAYEVYADLSKQDSEKYPLHTKDGHDNGHAEYLKYKNQLDENLVDSLQWHYNKRSEELKQAQDLAQNYADSRENIVKQVDKKTWNEEGYESFSQEELDLLDTFINETDYVNENIFITDYDSVDDIINAQTKLLDLATTDLEISSQPQYRYSTTLDNFLTQVENKQWINDLNLYDFLYIELADSIVVKLRLFSIEFNPFLLDNNINLQFTNMLKSRTKRNDLAELIAAKGSASKNQATIYQSTKPDDDAAIHLTSGFLQKLVNSSIFQEAIQNGLAGSTGGSINAGNLENEMINATDIHSKNGFFEYLQSQLIAADKIVANSGTFDKLSALVAQIDNLLAGNISAELGHLIELTAENVRIDKAVIRDMIAAQITVSMLQAGTISADKFHISSDDGGMEIVGNTMQFKDKNGTVRIQIGRDNNNNFTFCLYDETGKGILIDSTGIKKSAIADGLIVNNMISDGTIGKEKFNFSILETDENGNITQNGKVVIDKNGINAEFNTIKNSVTSIQGQLEKIENNASFTLNIFSSNGTVFKHGLIDTYLSPNLYMGQEDVTDKYPDKQFIWTRQSSDSDGDKYWNLAHQTGTKSLHITNSDIFIGASFTCSFYDGATLVAKAVF
mgnify:FL=1